MGLWHRLTGWGEARAMPPTTNSFAAASGIWASEGPEAAVNAIAAENLATVLACVNAIAGALATLPVYVYRTSATGRTEAPDHPVARLIRRPHALLTWPELVEWWVAQVLLHGNGLMVAEPDGAGAIASLVPVPWPNVRPVIVAGGRLAFDVTEMTGPYGAVSAQRRILDSEVVILRDRSDDGVIGRSRISRAKEVVGNAVALQDWSAATWRNAATPSGAIKINGSLTEEQFKRVKSQIEQNVGGTANAKRVLILDNGASFEAMSCSPEDAEVLASRRFSVEELCRIFNVPPPIVQDYTHNTFTNSAQASLWFASNTLAPWCRKIEAAFARSVFRPDESDMSIELDLSGLMRGDFEARWKANVAAVGANILDANEVREQEGFNPRPAEPAGSGL